MSRDECIYASVFFVFLWYPLYSRFIFLDILTCQASMTSATVDVDSDLNKAVDLNFTVFRWFFIAGQYSNFQIRVKNEMETC